MLIGILSPPGSFIAPSPSPSIPASPRLQPSPSQSPFGQDVLLVTNNTVVTQESDHKTTIPTRRPSFHQVANSPNAGTVLFRPSPTQSPAGASTFITNTGTELNTTLVGSNNIALNKKIGKKTAQPHGGHGHGMSATASSPKASKKAMSLTNSPITSPSPIASPTLNTTLRPPTPQPIIQQIPVMSSGNQLLQIIQGPQIIAPQRQAHIISSAQAIAPQHTQQPGQFVGHQQQQIKNNKAPQQILPKPTTTVLQVTPGGKNTTTVAKGTLQIGHHQPNPSQQQQTQLQTQIVQSQAPQVVQQAQQSAPPHQVISAAAQTTATANATQGNIILPTGGLNTQPLLVNQMPVIVQQNTPQGVQFILRPSAPQITAPGLVIHNTRPQLPPPQPQQLLRIVNANGSMQLAAATPTFIVSSQANLIQQNLQGIKTNTGTPLTQLGGLQAQRQPQQIAAAINQHLIGQSVAQIQNLQLNGNLTHIQMPNGLNGQFISQLPSQFQQSLTGFNQLNQNISLNQISSTNLSQIAAAAAASQNMAAFQSPPPPQQSHGGDLVVSAQMQFTAQHQNTITVSQAQQLAQQQIPPIPISPIMSPQHPTILQSVTPEPVRNPPTPVKHTAHGKMQQVEKIDSKNEGSSGGGKHDSASGKATSVSTSKPKKAKKSKKKQSSSNSDTGGAIMSTGKLDLANVMKLCGIMDDDDLMDGEMDMPMTTADPQMEIKETSPQMQQEQNVASTAGDIMITIPFSGQNTDIPFSFTIPNSVENSDTMQQQQQKVTTAVAKVTPELKSDPVVQTVQTNSTPGSGAPFMITIDSTEGTLGQPYTISIPHIPSSDSGEKSGVIVSGQSMATDAGGSVGITLPQTSMCVPTFVNTVLSSTVTPTLQSQINEIQNQLMGVVTPTTTTTASAVPSTTASTANTSTVVTIATPTTPTSTTSSTTPPGGTGGGGSNKKKSSKKNSKKLEKAVKNLVGVVPGQIGNIQISQVDGTKAAPMSAKNVIDNQIQITPIMDTTKGQLQQMTSVAPQQQIIVSASQQVVGLPNIVTTASSGAGTNVVHQPQILQHQIATAAPIQSVAAPNVVNLQPNIVQPNVQINLPNNLQPQIAPHPLMPQLTGALSLSLAEDGRLFLRHDANAPQDAQSQVILQTILSGALGNVTLITEPPNVEKQQPQQQQQQQVLAQQQQSTPVQNQPKIFTNNIIAPQKSLPTQQSIVTTHQGKSIVIPAAAAQASTAHFIPQTPTSAATTIASGGSQQLSSALFSTAQGQILQQTSPVVTQNTIFSSQSSQQPQSVQLTTTASVIQQPEVQQGLKNVRKVQQATAQLQTSTATISPQSTAVLMNPNMPKFVELPKIGPNQQLFSLNTITNQITQINPGLTTASLGPMERLLIVPAGINAQQLAQCLLQGQIHFNNIGQVNQAQDRIESTQQSQMNSQKLPTVAGPQVSSSTLQITTTAATSVSNHQSAVQQQQLSQLPKDPPKVTAAAVKVSENKVKKAAKVKKLKPVSEAKVIKMTQPTKNVVMMENRTLQKCNHFNDSSTKAQGRALVHPCTVSSAVATSNALSTSLGNVQLNTTVVCSTPTTSSVHVPNTAIVRPSIISNNARHQASSTNAHSHPILSPAINQAQPQQQPQVVQPMITSPSPDHHTHHQQPLIQPKVHSQPANAANSKNHATGSTGGSLPPLVSVNTTLPRVQTIQLTPQKQQMLKDVQMKIQTLSGKLQNKTLLSTLTIPMDYDATSSVYNQPLPTLTNLHAMTDADIHAALQRLFLEQQKILATGKIIPTIPTSHSFPTMAPAAVPTTQLQVAVALPKQSATPGGGFLPSPIEITPPMAIKQEIHPSPAVAVTAATASTASPTILLTNAKILPGNSSHQLLAPNVNAESISAPQMSPKMKIPRQCLFERQLAVDQEGCTNPDAKTPFHSKEDAIKRLIRYHCTYGDGENEEEVQSEMEAFEKTANQFQDQFNGMINKYQLLLMKESTHHVQTSELMMIDRLLVSDIQKEILNIQMNISNDLNVSAKVQESSSEAGEIVPPSHVKSEVKCEVKKEDVIVESKSVSDVSSTAGAAAGDVTTSAQNRPPSRATTAVAAAAAAASDVKHVSVVHYGTANSGSSGTNQLSAKNPSSDTKKEMEQFDIESEITPSFIMKKCESAPTKNQDLVEDGYQFGLDYYQQQQQQQQQDVAIKDAEPPDEDSKPEPYDEWLCIQKELGYISESNKRNEMKLSEISMGTSPNSSPLDHSKSVEKQLSEIFDHHSPKSVEHQLNDLFNPPSTSAKSNTESIVTSNSPLSEFFNTDSIVGNAGDKSVETRLEAMFGEAPEDDKADLVETRLEALFQGATQDSTTSYTAINPHTANNLHPGMLQSNMNKRQWNNGDILMSPASGNDSGESTCFPKRSFMGTAADNFVDSTTHMGNNNRWMSDYSNTPTMDHHPHSLDHQQPSSQQYDFMGDTMDCVLGETNQHHHTGEDGTTEINKRLWNGDLLAAHADVVPSKKMCFINKDMLDRDFMDMGGTPTQHQVSEMSMQHHHQMNHTGCGSMNTMTMGSAGGAGGAVVASQNNSISISMSTSSNFDEDISRQVQNAIDSILNLQSSEADSFHFSLDQMGSFLSDTALTPIIPTLQQQQQQPTTSQTSAVTRPPSVAKRKQLPATHFNHHTHQNQMQQHLEELSDCLMHGGSAESSGHHIIIDSSPSGSSSSSSTTAVSDFNSVTPSHDSAGLDDTVKSIITS
ncbi:mucin-2 isoform X2 [Lutzomyia longipalpis]|uniref:mucin-2 isoform X2 n=1 Tax=Lutzomyia longipalpis TaxID=7200 RepID=UPI002483D433|nr:mucin-2 isoform X2 [Lutzomyia longipalpis]